MKKKIVFTLSVIAGVALLSLAADSPGPKPGEADGLRELRAQVTQLSSEVERLRQLRAEVETLQQRTKSLESSIENLKRSNVPTPLNLQPGAGGAK